MSAPITLNIKRVARCWIDHRQIENSSDSTSAISRLTSTRDEFNRAVKDANKHLKSYCRQNGWKLIQHLKITENGLNKGELHLSYKGNQNIFNNFNVLSADFLRVQCIKSNSESHILNESSREGPTWVWQDVGWGLKRGGMWDTRFFNGEIRVEDRKARLGHTPIWR